MARLAAPALDPLKRFGSVLLAGVLLSYEAADAVFGPFVRPLFARLAALRVFQRIGDAIASLQPYVVLFLLAAPFVAIEPFKFVALYWLAQGKFALGAVTLASAHLLSFFVCERIFHAGREKLLSIGWFARGYGFVTRLRAQALVWVRETAAWRAAKAAVARARAGLARLTA